jgi:hypothetical protein
MRGKYAVLQPAGTPPDWQARSHIPMQADACMQLYAFLTILAPGAEGGLT